MKFINTHLIQRILYSTDISLYEVIPSAICRPRSQNDVKVILDFCISKNMTITPRGCGTSTVGQAIGSGLIMDFSKYMNKILSIGKDFVDVQPGIILSDLNNSLKKRGAFFPVDPSSAEVCTVGGMIGNNSSGIHSFLYGDTKDFVVGLEGFWSDGSFFSTITGTNVLPTIKKLSSFKQKANKAKKHLPSTTKNSSGYNILEALTKKEVSLDHLITGSEGTLCVITKIRLRTMPIPKKRDTLLALFNDIEKALSAVNLTKDINGISAIELLDDDLIRTVKEHFPEFKDFFNNDVKAGLLFEIDGTNELVDKSSKELEIILSSIAIKTDFATSDDKRKKLWWFRRSASAIWNRIHGSVRSIRFIEDVAVPLDKVVDFYKAEKDILQKYGLTAVFFGHIGSGHFHINPRIDTRDPDSQKKISEIATKTFELVKTLDGTFSAEHGDGVLREPFIKKLQPELYELFYEIKNELDPKWLLNPGKIVSKNGKQLPLRYDFKPISKATNEIVNAVERCHGCNDCIHFCMSKRINARDRASLMRNIVNGNISNNEDLKKAVSYIEGCRLCGKCLLNCPTGVNILETASLLRESKILPVPLFKQCLMGLFSPLKVLLQHELDTTKKDSSLKVNRIFNPIFRLGLYYRPYIKELLKVIKAKNISLIFSNAELQEYITLSI